jgi:hypothetical protein
MSEQTVSPCGLNLNDNSSKCKTVVLGCGQIGVGMVIVENGDYNENKTFFVVSNLIVEGENRINTKIRADSSVSGFLFCLNTSNVKFQVQCLTLFLCRADEFKMFNMYDSLLESSLIFTNCLFTQWSGVDLAYGGVVAVDCIRKCPYTNNVVFQACDFNNIVVANMSVLFFSNIKSVSVLNSAFFNISCENKTSHSSCMSILSGSIIYISHSSFRSCKSYGKGGSLDFVYLIEILLRDSIFVDCCSYSFGGGCISINFALSASCLFNNCSFIHGAASLGGGGYYSSSGCVETISNSYFYNCTGGDTKGGGAVFFLNSNFTNISACSFINCYGGYGLFVMCVIKCEIFFYFFYLE